MTNICRFIGFFYGFPRWSIAVYMLNFAGVNLALIGFSPYRPVNGGTVGKGRSSAAKLRSQALALNPTAVASAF